MRKYILAILLATVITVGIEVYQGSTAWSQSGTVNWTGTVTIFNPNSMNQYFVEPFSVVTQSHGSFNFTAYVVLQRDFPVLGHNVTVIQDHDGAILYR